ncbi:hypothetical protein FACS1894163_07220 [Spirochaetia bacterium]|nr:hypothetical protein FACS1894163_07220 [Spirochaetia bacterium]
MNKVDIINLLERYKNISSILHLQKDIENFNEIIRLINENYSMPSSTGNKNTKEDKDKFDRIVENKGFDLRKYSIKSCIIENKDEMCSFWDSLVENKKLEFTIFELNIILYFISEQYNKYINKDKNRIILIINNLVKKLQLMDSYNKIVV